MGGDVLPVAIVAIVFSYLIVKSALRVVERRIELRSQQRSTPLSDQTIAELKKEITDVRHVANEYDLSIQHTLDNIVRRLDNLESQHLTSNSPTRPYTPAPQEEQRVFAGEDYENRTN